MDDFLLGRDNGFDGEILKKPHMPTKFLQLGENCHMCHAIVQAQAFARP